VFADDFGRTASNLGAQWTQVAGLWLTNGRVAGSDLDGTNLAVATPSSCGDCEVTARLQTFGVPETGLALRAQGSARYAAVLRGNGQLELRRYSSTTAFTVLASGPSGLPDPTEPLTLTLSARGSTSVALAVSVNGAVRLSATDASSAALRSPGLAGLATTSAGVWFDELRVRTIAAP
jgi:hypothetical protein